MERMTSQLYKRLKHFQFDHIYYELPDINGMLQRSSGNYSKDFTPEILQTLDTLVINSRGSVAGTYIDNNVYYVFFGVSVATRDNRNKFHKQSVEAFRHLTDNKIMLQVIDPAGLNGVVYASVILKDRIHLNVVINDFEYIKNRFLREGFENVSLKHDDVSYRCVYCYDTPEGFCANLRRLK